MSENFRDKKWFKDMPQERKDRICKEFGITEDNLKKAGRETDDGRIVIDVMRLHYPVPVSWEHYYNWIRDAGMPGLFEELSKLDGNDSVAPVIDVMCRMLELDPDIRLGKSRKCPPGRCFWTRETLLDLWDEYCKAKENGADTETLWWHAKRLHGQLELLLVGDLNLRKD